MAEIDRSILLSIESLSALSVRLARLGDHIETALAPITTWELFETASYLTNARDDIKTAVLVCGSLARLRFGVAELAERVLQHPHWDAAAVARDIRALLDDPPDLPEASRSSHYS